MTVGDVEEQSVVSPPVEQVDRVDGVEAVPGTRPSGPALRWCYRLIVAVAVSPITVAAVRRGLEGWEPSWDVATTVVRIRDVFSAHPPLTGMAAAPSWSAEVPYSFPGALHLYLLAVPVKVLGTTWGVLLGMAVINTAVCVVALWLLRRRLGERWAMVGALFLTALLWTVGSGTSIYPTPLAIGVIPLFAFLVAAWSVADGDPPALLVLAVVGNYLFLDQLVFIVVVPVVGVVALGMLGARLWRARRHDRSGWPPRRRRYGRWLAAGVGFTVVVWIPPLVDQFLMPGDNLGKLLHAFTSGQVAGDKPGSPEPTLTAALGVVASVTAVPRAWLPPSFSKVPFHPDGGGSPFVVGLAWTMVLFGVLAWGAWRALRRRDFRVTTAIAVAVACWAAYVFTALHNPDWRGYQQRYFLGLWPLGAFLWLVALIGIVTGWPGMLSRGRRWSTHGLAAVAAVAVVLAVVAGYRTTEAPAMRPSRSNPIAKSVRHKVATAGLGPGPVLVTSASRTRNLLPSVLLGLQDAGVQFRVSFAFDAQQFGAWRDETQQRDAVAQVHIGGPSVRRPGERLVFVETPPPVMTAQRFDEVDAALHRWITRPGRIRTAPGAVDDAKNRARIEDGLADLRRRAASNGTDPLVDPNLAAVLATWGETPNGPLFDVPGLKDDDLRQWAREVLRRSPAARVVITTSPMH